MEGETMSDVLDKLETLFSAELDRMAKASNDFALDLDDVRKLQMLYQMRRTELDRQEKRDDALIRGKSEAELQRLLVEGDE
jgi:hypothetical protein